MIDPNWQLTDLDPLTWRNLGRFIDPAQYIRAAQPGERGLFILHDGRRVLRVVDEVSADDQLRHLIHDVSNPAALAEELFAEGRWDRVHVINKLHLASVAREAQRIENRALDLDAYYRHVSHLIWGQPDGYACMPAKPRTWNGWTYDMIQGYVKALPDRASVALGVFDGDAVHIGLVVESTAGRVTRLTTFEALHLAAADLRPTAGGLDAIWRGLERVCHPPAAALVCALPVFEAWLAADDKAKALEQAARAGRAFWRLGSGIG